MPRNVSNITEGLHLNKNFKVAIFYGDVKTKYLQNLPNNIEMIVIYRLVGKALYPVNRWNQALWLRYPRVNDMHMNGETMSDEVFNNFPYSLSRLYINQTNLRIENIRVPFGMEDVEIIDHLANDHVLHESNKDGCDGSCQCSQRTCGDCGNCCDCDADPFITCGKRDAIEAKKRFVDYVKIAYRHYGESQICHVMNLEPEYRRKIRGQMRDGEDVHRIEDYAHLMKVKKGRSLFAYHTHSQIAPAYKIAEFFDEAKTSGKTPAERYDLDHHCKKFYEFYQTFSDRDHPVYKAKNAERDEATYNRVLKRYREHKRNYNFLYNRVSKRIEGVETPTVSQLAEASKALKTIKNELYYQRKCLEGYVLKVNN